MKYMDFSPFSLQALLCHPDKGGDANVFKKLNAAFEVLRDMCEKHKILSFLSTLDQSTTAVYMNAAQSAKGFQSWDYFQSAAEEPVPIYRVEKTKSGRGYCSAKGGARKCSDGDKVKIDLGEIRVGWMNLQSGTYSTWVHLKCWRVPSKVRLFVPQCQCGLHRRIEQIHAVGKPQPS